MERVLQPGLQHGDRELNLVHAGDLIKLGFGLNGDRGLNIFAAGFPSSYQVACPAWTPHSVPAAGAGSTAGAELRRRVRPLHVRVADSTAWAGTCRGFELQLNDGSARCTRPTSCSSANGTSAQTVRAEGPGDGALRVSREGTPAGVGKTGRLSKISILNGIPKCA